MMAVQYTVQISDADFRALCFKAENPHQYVDDHVTEYISQMKQQLIKELVKQELEKPGTRSIPADGETLLTNAVVKTSKQMEAEDTERMIGMVANPDAPEMQVAGEAAYLP
jgi:hypothetical protein